MQPVVDVGVTKGSRVVQAFRKRNEKFGKAIVIVYGESGSVQFTEMLGTLQAKTDVTPVVDLACSDGALPSCLGVLSNRSDYTKMQMDTYIEIIYGKKSADESVQKWKSSGRNNIIKEMNGTQPSNNGHIERRYWGTNQRLHSIIIYFQILYITL